MKKRELGIYIHIPFCVRKCRYCDFLSFPADEPAREAYVRQLIREIQCFPDKLSGMNALSTDLHFDAVPSVFIGGGTPSLLTSGQLARILLAVREVFSVKKDAEITMECNPGTVADYGALLEMGINRLSFGVQSSCNDELEILGRIHTWEDAVRSFHAARKAGFKNISTDLIFSLPGRETGQTLQRWLRTLHDVISLNPEHISAYSLIIEEGTPFYQIYGKEDQMRMRGASPLHLPDEDTEREMYHRAVEVLGEAGYHRYEISNFARTGYESIHNTGYWIRREYAGFGLGAASQIGMLRCRGITDLNEYLKWNPGRLPEKNGEVEFLKVSDEMSETMFLGLRRMAGVSEEEFHRRFGREIDEVWPGAGEDLIGKGLLENTDKVYRLTDKGVDLSNYVFAQFLL